MFIILTHIITEYPCTTTVCVKKFYPPPWGFLISFPKRLRIFNKNFTRLLLVHTYAKLQNFIQLSPTMTKLCRIKRDHPVNFYISQHICHEFLPCDAMHSAAIAGTRCPSVCLSVTFVSCPKTNIDIFAIFSPCGSQAILVFPYHTGWRYSNRNPLTGASNARGVWKNVDFRPISRSISETVIAMGTCSETICKHRILFPSMQHLAWLPQGRPQGKQKCGKNSDFWTYALT